MSQELINKHPRVVPRIRIMVEDSSVAVFVTKKLTPLRDNVFTLSAKQSGQTFNHQFHHSGF